MAGDGALAGIFTYVGWAFLPNVRIPQSGPQIVASYAGHILIVYHRTARDFCRPEPILQPDHQSRLPKASAGTGPLCLSSPAHPRLRSQPLSRLHTGANTL